MTTASALSRVTLAAACTLLNCRQSALSFQVLLSMTSTLALFTLMLSNTTWVACPCGSALAWGCLALRVGACLGVPSLAGWRLLVVAIPCEWASSGVAFPCGLARLRGDVTGLLLYICCITAWVPPLTDWRWPPLRVGAALRVLPQGC